MLMYQQWITPRGIIPVKRLRDELREAPAYDEDHRRLFPKVYRNNEGPNDKLKPKTS
jgi:hypothetical protein